MILRCLITAAVLILGSGAPADQPPVVPARDSVRTVAANELQDRVQQLRWIYEIDKRLGKQTVTEEQVETAQGPLYRVRAIDGRPLTADERQKDDARIAGLLRDPSQQLKLKQQQDDDEKKLEHLLRVMPDAFLYEYDGTD